MCVLGENELGMYYIEAHIFLDKLVSACVHLNVFFVCRTFSQLGGYSGFFRKCLIFAIQRVAKRGRKK